MRSSNHVWLIDCALASGLIHGGLLFAEPVATLSLEPGPKVAATPGAAVAFDLWLRDYTPDSLSDPVITFALNVAASDAGLTGGGADFSSFSFVLDSGLAGILGAFPGSDFDISDDGRLEISADFPTEPGIVQAMGDVLLGSLSVIAPNSPGNYAVNFNTDASSPIAQGGTFLLIDSGKSLPTLPGDGALNVLTSAIVVVPEPSSALLISLVLAGVCWRRSRFHQRPLNP